MTMDEFAGTGPGTSPMFRAGGARGGAAECGATL